MSTTPATPTNTTAPTSGKIVNAMSVDVEDYFHVEAFRKQVGRENWDKYPLRVENSTRRILELFAAHNCKATFFILGWVAEKLPKLVQEIAEQGHEIACHSMWHRLVYELDEEEFRRDTQAAVDRIQDACGQRVVGYRAPSFSITKRSLWALRVLQELGFEYDSSIFPVRHDVYGMPSFPRQPVRVELPNSQSIVEFPMSTAKLGASQLPGAGGGYLRIFPLSYSRFVFRQLNVKEKRPTVVYLHPWEIDPGQPRMSGPLRSRLRHYTGLKRMEKKLTYLLRNYAFAPMKDVLAQTPTLQTTSL